MKPKKITKIDLNLDNLDADSRSSIASLGLVSKMSRINSIHVTFVTTSIFVLTFWLHFFGLIA